MTTPGSLETAAASANTSNTAGQSGMEGIESTTLGVESSTTDQQPAASTLPERPTSTGAAQPSNIASSSETTLQGAGAPSTSAEESIHVYGPAATPPARNHTDPDLNADLPDSFFEPGLSDVQAHHASVLARSSKLNNAPLVTAKIRDAEVAEREKKKADRWPNTTIRVKFSDGTIVEKVFASTSPIQPVYDFVRSTLDDSVAGKTFVLWQPPRTQYPEHPIPAPMKKTPYSHQTKIIPPANYGPIKGGTSTALQGGTGGKETLFQLGLVPQSVLLVKWDGADEAMNASGYPAPLKEELRTKSVPLPPAQAKEPPAAGAGGSGAAGGAAKEKKIPKWLQKGLMKRK